ncbi:MAG TPA: S8 family serine peptidase [Cyclobacteriaceae bacterium]
MLLSISQSFSQVAANFNSIKDKYQSNFEIQKIKALEYASKHAIPLSQKTIEGNHLLLIDVVDGIPIFLSTLNMGAAITTGVSKIQGGSSGLDLNGEAMIVGVWDGGSVKDHIEFGSRILSNEITEDDSHATHVTGTLIAAGINSNAKGMAPMASVTSWYFDNDLAEMAALAKPDESSLLFSNHSYGTVTGWTKINGIWSWTGDQSVSPDEDFRFGLYGEKAAALDELANLAPYYTIVWAAGNDRGESGNGSRPPDCNGGTGYDCIIPEAVAKNIITVGAVDKMNSYTSPSGVMMSSFSNWGPTDDGRIKPDIVGAGVNLLSTSAVGVDTYEVRSGTSMATPNVAGSLVLIQDLYKKLYGGAVMKSATLKALAIHTAKEAGPLPGPDYSFGWGLLDAEAAAHLLITQDGINNVVEELVLANGVSFEKILNPKANQKITATIVWNDPAATQQPSFLDAQQLMLVNDLDIKLVAENGTEYYPWLLDPATPAAQAIKGNNYRDNVEKLEFNLPEAKPYRLVVNHKGQLSGGKQSFSLILSYQSTLFSFNTLYWIGDSGNWGDNTHWSLTSGGSPAFRVPSAMDQVIVDENSFDGLGPDQISLLQNQSVASIKWLRSTAANLELQNNTLTVGKEVVVADGSLKAIGAGTIKCISNAKGNLYFTDTDLGSIQLRFDGGEWEVRGNLSADQLGLIAGKLTINKSKLNLNRLNLTSSSSKELRIDNSEIRIADQSEVDGNTVTIDAATSKIILEAPAIVLNWSEVNFDGELQIGASNVSVAGSNFIRYLRVNPGTSINISDGSVLKVDSLSGFEGQVGNPISISSSTKSTIEITSHFLLCSDYININNVDLIGSARINLGPNSLLINSLNWLSQPCATVLFANFDASYLCQNGFTEFIDKSVGPVTSWEWDFGDSGSIANSSTFKNSYHGFENAGVYQVQLIIRDGQSTASFSKEIEISPSQLNPIDIAVNSTHLTCLSTASYYQWFVDEQVIQGATDRSYFYDGNDGVYRVVTYDGECNHSSRLLTITELEADNQINIYPNPAKDLLNVIGLKSNSWILLRDAVGKILFTNIANKDMTIPLGNVSAGIYFLQIENSEAIIIKKIAVYK